MQLLDAFALIITLTALFAYFNEKFLKLPSTIGVTLVGLVASLFLLAVNAMGANLVPTAQKVLEQIDFGTFLMEGVLSFLLFAGALNVNAEVLRKYKTPVLVMAVFSTLISTFLIGGLTYWILGLFGMQIPLIYALLFGALISPTDPIAVLDLVKRAKVPQKLESLIAGESLFNDGVGVVVFAVIASLAFGGGHGGHEAMGALDILRLFAQEALGGALFGAVLGYFAFLMLRSIDQYIPELLITIALVMGGYALAQTLHVSGPIAMVIAGLIIGQQGRQHAMSDKTREHVDQFWEMTDQILNAVLFVLIGLEVLLLKWPDNGHLLLLVMVPVVLAVRWISVGLPVSLLRKPFALQPYTVRMMTWGGLRGGIAIALALSIPVESAYRELILTLTYGVVVFSILVQGLTVMPLAVKAAAEGSADVMQNR
ncbi:cation:proton antiporter [Deinococcus cellulosilyticus]|uniref:Sodium:proton antiporter n=1 Tax=Deinococcus cellulosilyticus (strain DSM 18568 / NBRC 106333 / KACC 11606 / 5516J-15) TaxID=1223518 RepID=A0A511N735_DEIC1|nr:sodium:proton antiporter [Deinococcus cellulosilyticus]GEM48288.1 sodium:proton antiporter [Deinococcus cellulosilyticus NBRC 106333 = KACC 11606]